MRFLWSSLFPAGVVFAEHLFGLSSIPNPSLQCRLVQRFRVVSLSILYFTFSPTSLPSAQGWFQIVQRPGSALFPRLPPSPSPPQYLKTYSILAMSALTCSHAPPPAPPRRSLTYFQLSASLVEGTGPFLSWLQETGERRWVGCLLPGSSGLGGGGGRLQGPGCPPW